MLTAINSFYNDVRKKGEGTNILARRSLLICRTMLFSIYEVNVFIFTWQTTKLTPTELGQPTKGYIAIKWQSRNSTQNLIPKFLFLPEITIFLLWMMTAFVNLREAICRIHFSKVSEAEFLGSVTGYIDG